MRQILLPGFPAGLQLGQNLPQLGGVRGFGDRFEIGLDLLKRFLAAVFFEV